MQGYAPWPSTAIAQQTPRVAPVDLDVGRVPPGRTGTYHHGPGDRDDPAPVRIPDGQEVTIECSLVPVIEVGGVRAVDVSAVDVTLQGDGP